MKLKTRTSFFTELLIMAILFSFCGKISKGQSDLQKSVNPDFKINYDMLQMFNEFKAREVISETFYYRLLFDSEIRNSIAWVQIWNEYKESIFQKTDPLKNEDFVDIIREEQVNLNKTHRLLIEEPAIYSGSGNNMDDGFKKNELNQNFSSPKLALRYHIQIAASINPLTQSELQKLFPDVDQIRSFREDQWTKYYVGYFNHFLIARNFLKNLHIEGAFIIAFLFDQKLLAYQAREIERVMAEHPIKILQINEEAQFRIQLAASQRLLTPAQLQRIYPQIDEVGMIYYDGWFKYSIKGSSTLTESLLKAKNTKVSDAFVVRYQNNKRIALQ